MLPGVLQMTPAERGLLRMAYRDILWSLEGTGDTIEEVMRERYGIAPPDLQLRPDAIVAAPWGPDEVASLAGYQHSGSAHPFTCGDDACRGRTHGVPLMATSVGWECPGCGYTQNWAWVFMTNYWWRGPGPWPHIVYSSPHCPARLPDGDDSSRKALPC
jgi:hypothetical protein